MRYRVNARTRALVLELRRLAAEVDPYVASASQDARAEWKATRSAWPSDVELARGFVEISDDDLEVMRSRVHRFGEILGFQKAGAKVTPNGGVGEAAATTQMTRLVSAASVDSVADVRLGDEHTGLRVLEREGYRMPLTR